MQTPRVLLAPARSGTLRIGFALLLAALLPPSLLLWARKLDAWVALPAYGSPAPGFLVAGIGLLLILTAAYELRSRPNRTRTPHPAPQTQSRGVFVLLKYPIHLGLILLAVGLSLATRSPSGLWIVSPLIALAAAALVWGRPSALREGTRAGIDSPRLDLPADSRDRPDGWDRGFVYLKVFAPWFFLYMAIEFLGVPPDAIEGRFHWEFLWPVLPWTEVVYILTYPFVMLAPLAAPRKADLRLFVLRAYGAMALLFSIYLLSPLIAPARPVPGEGLLQDLMRLERRWDRPVTALPSFHVVWSCIAASLYASVWPRRAWLSWLFAVAISISCVTTGMHAVLDIVAGYLAFALIARGPRLIRFLDGITRRVSNVNLEVSLGPAGIVAPGILASVGAGLGFSVSMVFAGPQTAAWLAALALAVFLGATLPGWFAVGRWALPASSDYLIAVLAVSPFAVVASRSGAPVWLLLAAASIGAGLAEAVSGLKALRTRGRQPDTPPRSIGGLSAPLFSSARALLTSLVLVRLWMLGMPLSFLVGFYLILSGLGRFLEEPYRSGQTETGTIQAQQGLCAGLVLTGAFLTTLGGPAAPPIVGLPPAAALAILLVAFAGLLAGGVRIVRPSSSAA